MDSYQYDLGVQEVSSFIHILPELRSNGRLLKDFQKQLSCCIDLNVDQLATSHRPLFIIFRPQGRPKDEFQCVVQTHIVKHCLCQEDIFMITAFNNVKGNDAFIEETGLKFKVVETIILSNGSLDVASNQQTFDRLSRILIYDYGFKTPPDELQHRNPMVTSVDGKQDALTDSRKSAESLMETFLKNSREMVIQNAQNLESWMDEMERQFNSETQVGKTNYDPCAAERFKKSRDSLQEEFRSWKNMSSDRSVSPEFQMESEVQKMYRFVCDVERMLSWIQEKNREVESTEDGFVNGHNIQASIAAYDVQIESVSKAKLTFLNEYFVPQTIQSKLDALFLLLKGKSACKMLEIRETQKAMLMKQVIDDLNIWMSQLDCEDPVKSPVKDQGAVEKKTFEKSKWKLFQIADDSRDVKKFFSKVEKELLWIQEKQQTTELPAGKQSLPDVIRKYKILMNEIEHQPSIELVANAQKPFESKYFDAQGIQSRLIQLYEQLKKRTDTRISKLEKELEGQKKVNSIWKWFTGKPS